MKSLHERISHRIMMYWANCDSKIPNQYTLEDIIKEESVRTIEIDYTDKLWWVVGRETAGESMEIADTDNPSRELSEILKEADIKPVFLDVPRPVP